MIKPLFIGIIFLAGCLMVNGQGTDANRALIKARYLLSEKLYTEALATLEDQQAMGTDRMRSALAMGQVFSGLGKFGESNSWLRQVTGEGLAEAYYFMARNYVALNDFASAVEYLGKHLADKNHLPKKQILLDPAFSKLENNRDWIHLWQTDWYSLSEQQMAECEYLVSLGHVDEARVLADQALAGSPDEPLAWFLLARINFMQKEDRQFRQALEKAWQLASGHISLKNEMLQFALEAQWYEKVNSMASELIRIDPSNPEYLIARSLVRILGGKESLALKEIENTEESGIAPAELYYQAGLKISSSMPLQAESYLSKAIDTGIMDARFYYVRGTVRSRLDNIEQALGDLAMSLDINPNQPGLYFERAQLRLDQGDTEGACHDWQRALEMGNSKAADRLYKYCRLP